MIIDAHEVAPRLWVGSRPTASLRHAFDVLVLCSAEDQDVDSDIETIKAPFQDGPLTPQTQRIALAAAAKVVKRLQAGKRVLVTCHAGINRSALVAALALMQFGTPAGLAINVVRTRRRPPSGIKVLHNHYFESWLRVLGEKAGPCLSG